VFVTGAVKHKDR